MPKLLVDDSGAKRAFRLGNGRLTIGSDAACKLRLSSEGVAPRHATLTIEDGSVRLLAESPVEFAGRRHTGDLELPLGSTVLLGSASLTIAADAADPVPAVPARPVPARAVPGKAPAASGKAPAVAGKGRPAETAASAGAAKAAGGTRRPAATRRGADRADPEERPSAGRRRSAPKQTGMPGWVIPVALVVLGGGATAAFLMKGGGPSNPGQILTVVEELLAEGNIDTAKAKLAEFDRSALSAELKQRFDSLSAKASGSLTQESAKKRAEGIGWSQKNLLDYADRHIDKSAPQPERVRLFLERLAEFRQLFPEQRTPLWTDNNEGKSLLGQIAALEQSYQGVVRLTDPLNLADIEWTRTFFTSGGKSGKGDRDYQVVLDRLERARLGGGITAAEAASLKDELLKERNAYIDSEIKDSQKEYERYLQDKDLNALRSAAAKLVYLIHRNPDPAVRDYVAAPLLKFQNLAQEILPSWREHKPAEWQSLMQVPGIAALVPQMPPPPEK